MAPDLLTGEVLPHQPEPYNPPSMMECELQKLWNNLMFCSMQHHQHLGSCWASVKKLVHIGVSDLAWRVFMLVPSARKLFPQVPTQLLSSFRALVKCCLINKALPTTLLNCILNSLPAPSPIHSLQHLHDPLYILLGHCLPSTPF